MNRKIYKKICLALTISIFCFVNLTIAQNAKKAGKAIRGLSPKSYVIEGQSNLKSDIKQVPRPIATKPIINPKGIPIKAMGAPTNDDCFSAIFLNVGTSCNGVNFDQAGATESMPASLCSEIGRASCRERV